MGESDWVGSLTRKNREDLRLKRGRVHLGAVDGTLDFL